MVVLSTNGGKKVKELCSFFKCCDTNEHNEHTAIDKLMCLFLLKFMKLFSVCVVFYL